MIQANAVPQTCDDGNAIDNDDCSNVCTTSTTTSTTVDNELDDDVHYDDQHHDLDYEVHDDDHEGDHDDHEVHDDDHESHHDDHEIHDDEHEGDHDDDEVHDDRHEGHHHLDHGPRKALRGAEEALRDHRGQSAQEVRQPSEAVKAAKDGATIKVEGFCVGSTLIKYREDLTIEGVPPTSDGCPKDGPGRRGRLHPQRQEQRR